jgi:hypothetical protein
MRRCLYKGEGVIFMTVELNNDMAAMVGALNGIARYIGA